MVYLSGSEILIFSSSVQFKTEPMRSENPIYAPPRLSEVFPALPLKRVQHSSDGRWTFFRPFNWRSSSASSFHASLLQAIDGVVSVAVCLQLVSQAPQHFRSSETQSCCDGCFSRQFFCTVISLASDMPRTFECGCRTMTHGCQFGLPFCF